MGNAVFLTMSKATVSAFSSKWGPTILAAVFSLVGVLFMGWARNLIANENAHLVTRKEFSDYTTAHDKWGNTVLDGIHEKLHRIDDVAAKVDQIAEMVARLDERSRRQSDLSTKGTQ
jgi:hypothetical protein